MAISGGSLLGTGAIHGKLTGGGNITPSGTVAGYRSPICLAQADAEPNREGENYDLKHGYLL